MTQPAGSNVAVPYIAPWAANWNKYSTQVYNMPRGSGADATIIIPSSQWWRIIYLAAQFTTSATAGTRAIFLGFSAGSATNMRLAPSATTPVSTVTYITYGLGLNTVSTPIQNGHQYLSVALVDLLWKPKTQITIGFDTGPANDTLDADPALAVEIYTEFTSEAGAPVLIPSPVLT